MKVKALDTYIRKNIQDKELNRIPKPGEVIEISKERLNLLLGDNPYKEAFIELLDDKEERATLPKMEEKALMPKVENKKKPSKKK